MSALTRNNVKVIGNGTRTIVFSHGFGCDQHMWRLITGSFEDDYQIVLFDHVGAGKSDLSAYDRAKYSTLEGYATDVLEICTELGLADVIFVGHSVSAMVGVIASLREPALFKSLILVGPSPRYINENGYVGGFTRSGVDDLLSFLETNHLGWSAAMAPLIMANLDRPELAEELQNSFCATDPEIARQFARVTFLSDNRADLANLTIPTLVLQCSEDVIAPLSVGEFCSRQIPDNKMVVLNATGHCPQLSAPDEVIAEIKKYLAT